MDWHQFIHGPQWKNSVYFGDAMMFPQNHLEVKFVVQSEMPWAVGWIFMHFGAGICGHHSPIVWLQTCYLKVFMSGLLWQYSFHQLKTFSIICDFLEEHLSSWTYSLELIVSAFWAPGFLLSSNCSEQFFSDVCILTQRALQHWPGFMCFDHVYKTME